jgi:hypothetical protein
MATDGPGVRMVLEAAAQAKQKKLALTSGFCWRYNPAERQIMQRIHDGQIGTPMALQNTYNTGSLWVKPRQTGWSEMTYQMRNWYYFTWLSGDHLVEQAVHSLDKMQGDEGRAASEVCRPRRPAGPTGADFGQHLRSFQRGLRVCRRRPRLPFLTAAGQHGIRQFDYFSSARREWRRSSHSGR